MSAWRDKEEFKARVLEWADKLSVKASALYVRPMRRKWASCSTAGTLSFNDELLGLDRALGEYVIVHELLHFSVPNHGKLWKSLMRAHLGDYEKQEEELEKIAHNHRLPGLQRSRTCTRVSLATRSRPIVRARVSGSRVLVFGAAARSPSGST